MEQAITVNQSSTEGSNSVTINLADDVFRPYDKELSVGVDKGFLNDASENLIRDGKLLLNESVIEQVERYLDEKKFCLIKAPEGRGKTYLSRIIAYRYHNDRKTEVFFLDFKDHNAISVSSIDDTIQEWHKNSPKDYLLVLENVHAYKYSTDLKNKIKDWVETKKNHIRFLLNTRPTYVELDDFSDWEETVRLTPSKEDVNRIIDLYSDEVNREPFADDEERSKFVEKICPDRKKVTGANLRLLKIYLETWQYHPEIQYISGVDVQTVIERFRTLYLKEDNVMRSKNEIEALWYLSSLFQFDVPLHEDFLPNVGNLGAAWLLRLEENRYHLPHSVDASFLYKAICDLKKKSLAGQMKTFVTRYINEILKSNDPREFESDFRLLISGLTTRKDEFNEAIYYLTQEDVAKEIITKVNPGFVIFFFRPENHESPDPKALKAYYLDDDNKVWLKAAILKSSPRLLAKICDVFKENLGIELMEDLFNNDTDKLKEYLSNNINVFDRASVFMAICKLGDEHKEIMRQHYKANKTQLKQVLLELPLANFDIVCGVFIKKLGYDILKDVFKDPSVLDAYMNGHYKFSLMPGLVLPMCKLGGSHKAILMVHYLRNKTALKPLFLKLSPERLTFVCMIYRDYLYLNIVKDLFDGDLEAVEKYLSDKRDKVFPQDAVLKTISGFGDAYKAVLDKYNVFERFFYSRPKGSYITQGLINKYWTKEDEQEKFDVRHVQYRSFYFDGVSWAGVHQLVALVQRNMNAENRQLSVDMVEEIIRNVFEKENALSLATSDDLAYFYSNVSRVDAALSQGLMNETAVIDDVKKRLDASNYTKGDLYLFDLFFSQPWCNDVLLQKINGADDTQKGIIKKWYDEFADKLKKNKKEIQKGSLLEYIHHNQGLLALSQAEGCEP